MDNQYDELVQERLARESALPQDHVSIAARTSEALEMACRNGDMPACFDRANWHSGDRIDIACGIALITMVAILVTRPVRSRVGHAIESRAARFLMAGAMIYWLLIITSLYVLDRLHAIEREQTWVALIAPPLIAAVGWRLLRWARSGRS